MTDEVQATIDAESAKRIPAAQDDLKLALEAVTLAMQNEQISVLNRRDAERKYYAAWERLKALRAIDAIKAQA